MWGARALCDVAKKSYVCDVADMPYVCDVADMPYVCDVADMSSETYTHAPLIHQRILKDLYTST